MFDKLSRKKTKQNKTIRSVPSITVRHYHPPSTVYLPPSIVHSPPSHRPPSTVHRPPSTVHRTLSTVHPQSPLSTIHYPLSSAEPVRLPPGAAPFTLAYIQRPWPWGTRPGHLMTSQWTASAAGQNSVPTSQSVSCARPRGLSGDRRPRRGSLHVSASVDWGLERYAEVLRAGECEEAFGSR